MTAAHEWSEQVAAGEAFVAQGFQPAVAGMIPLVQLFNPIGSGVRVRVRCWNPIPIFSVAINHNIWRHDVALTVLGAFSGPQNLLGGGAAPVAEVRTDSLLAGATSRFWLFLSAGNTRKSYPVEELDWGHDLLPGQGILNTGAAGSFVFLGMQWTELPL